MPDPGNRAQSGIAAWPCGRLADFAGAPTKGADVAIEGELRSHEYQRELAAGHTRDHPPPSEFGKFASTPC
jgi:hypothetical protein